MLLAELDYLNWIKLDSMSANYSQSTLCKSDSLHSSTILFLPKRSTFSHLHLNLMLLKTSLQVWQPPYIQHSQKTLVLQKNLHFLIFILCFQKTSLQAWQAHFMHNSQMIFFGQKVYFLAKQNLHLLIFIWVSKNTLLQIFYKQLMFCANKTSEKHLMFNIPIVSKPYLKSLTVPH